MGIAASTVRSFRRCRNITFPKTKLNISEDEFINKYNELKSQQAMAEFYKVDRHTINGFAKKISFDDTIYKRQKLTENEIQYIIDNYNNKSSTLIAKELNITESAVSGVWFRNNLRGKDSRSYYLLNERYFETIDSQDKAYFLGFIAADGCIHKHTNNRQDVLRFQIRHEDVKILEILKQQLNTNKPISYIGEYVSLEISSNLLVNDIKDKGLGYRKTYGNTIANIDSKYMPAFIRGYFDGDGSISYNNSLSLSIVGYESNMRKIMEYLESQNILSSFTVDKRQYNKNEYDDVFGSITITNNNMAYSLIKLMYKDSSEFYMNRKKEIADMFIKHIEESENIRDKQIVIYYKYAVQGLG